MRNSKGQFTKKHGETCCNSKISKEYRAWIHMKERCHGIRPSNPKYNYYKGKGIKVCDRWFNDFSVFLKDVGRASSKNMTLGRIDNNGNYEPNNVRWETPIQQANNRKKSSLIKFNGKRQGISQWARELGIGREVIRYRIKHGWSVEKTLTTPVRIKRKYIDNPE